MSGDRRSDPPLRLSRQRRGVLPTTIRSAVVATNLHDLPGSRAALTADADRAPGPGGVALVPRPVPSGPGRAGGASAGPRAPHPHVRPRASAGGRRGAAPGRRRDEHDGPPAVLREIRREGLRVPLGRDLSEAVLTRLQPTRATAAHAASTRATTIRATTARATTIRGRSAGPTGAPVRLGCHVALPRG